jgi:ABC-type branched-subunit amino acid transport system ATPase component
VEENITVAARGGRWDLAAVFKLFPRLAERRASSGNHLSGGETAEPCTSAISALESPETSKCLE